jgi:hypothetical protein
MMASAKASPPSAPDPVHGQHAADDAGARHQHVLALEAQLGRRQLRHLVRVGQALLAGAGVSAAAVGDQRLRAAVGQVLLAHEQRRRLHPVAGEDAHSGARPLRIEHAQVRPVTVFPDTRPHRARQEARHAGHAAPVNGHNIRTHSH